MFESRWEGKAGGATARLTAHGSIALWVPSAWPAQGLEWEQAAASPKALVPQRLGSWDCPADLEKLRLLAESECFSAHQATHGFLLL